jgi:hypothetical protein
MFFKLKFKAMKKIIFLLFTVFLIGHVTAQQTWNKISSSVFLFDEMDKVGVGCMPGAEKVLIQSKNGETPLALKGITNQISPFIICYSPMNTAIWKLYASPNLWTIGNSLDTTKAIISVKPAKSWFKVNGTMASTSVKTGSATIATLLRVPIYQTTVTVPSTYGSIYICSADSCLYYYNGTTSVKIKK